MLILNNSNATFCSINVNEKITIYTYNNFAIVHMNERIVIYIHLPCLSSFIKTYAVSMIVIDAMKIISCDAALAVTHLVLLLVVVTLQYYIIRKR